MRVLLTFLTMFTVAAHGDLLDRIKIEDTIQARIQDSFRMYDEKARVLVRFDYKKFQGILPGTNLESTAELLPERVDSSDISRIQVEIYTELEDVPTDAKEMVLRGIPIDKSRVQVAYKPLRAQFPKDEAPRGLDPQSFSAALEQSVSTWSSVFGAAIGLSVLGLIAFLFYQNQLRMREFRAQIGQLVTTLSEMSLGGPSPAAANTAMNAASAPLTSSSDEENPLAKMSLPSLKELIADCYWCEEDAYAAWIWKKLSPEARKNLLNELPYMKEYSLFFMDLAPREAAYHDHPAYLEPIGWHEVSEEDLAKMVRANGSLWHLISPLRQKHLPLSLEEKLKALRSEPSKSRPQTPTAKSRVRTLESKPTWGDLSLEDEKAVFEQPDIVPVPLRAHIKSLVWLAHKESSVVEKILARYDARALASAWVGPEEVLSKLESVLPEKKLKLLKTYTSKVSPSRQSQAYLALVEEGVRDEAA